MTKEKKYVKVLWLKAHYDYAYSAGDKGSVDADRAPLLMNGGFIIPVPDTDDEVPNPLPEDLPGRDKLFEVGFDTVDKIKKAGDSLLDAGISNTMLKKIKAYLD